MGKEKTLLALIEDQDTKQARLDMIPSRSEEIILALAEVARHSSSWRDMMYSALIHFVARRAPEEREAVKKTIAADIDKYAEAYGRLEANEAKRRKLS